MRSTGLLAASLVLVGACAMTEVRGAGGDARATFYRLSGSGDWEWLQSEGAAGGPRASFDAFRQRYSLDLAGSIWDHHFNRFLLGVDLYRDRRSVDGQGSHSSSVGYRASSTFFPNRAFPLRLFARRSTIESAAPALGDADRETGAWGVEWNLAAGSRRSARVQLASTSYDLLAPVALMERRKDGTIELSQRFRRRETTIRYGHNEQRELVRDTRFARQDLTLNDRTRFDNGVILLFSGSHAQSNARFITGERDELTQSRASASLDVPRKRRIGFGFGYDFIENSGRFVDSSSQRARGELRVLLGGHWETTFNAFTGTLESIVNASAVRQDSSGGSFGIRYNREWSHVDLAAAYALGISSTRFDVQPDRTVTTQGLDLNLRAPVGRRASLFASGAVRQNENDVTGVGYTYDETEARVGFDAGFGSGLRGGLSAYRRDTSYDTFQFGVQESTEHGIEGTLSRGRGSLSLTVSTREGISEFIPDPSSGGPFLPGNDLVSAADIATVGAHVRVRRRLSARVRLRYEDREFSSIGQESILSYHPEIEWSPGSWRFAFAVTHYERNNSTSFYQDTMLLRASRRFF